MNKSAPIEPRPIPTSSMRTMVKQVDGNDALIVLGLGLAGMGVALWSIQAALVMVGAVLLALGLWGAIIKSR